MAESARDREAAVTRFGVFLPTAEALNLRVLALLDGAYRERAALPSR